MVLTVTVQNSIGEFALKPEAGKYTFQVRKPNDATIQYDGSIAVTTDAQGNPTQIALSATVKDSKLSSPITFTGTLFGTPAQTGTVTGSIRSPAVARQLRSRQSSIAPYTEAKFTNVRLTSQFGTAAIGELKVVWLRDSLEEEKVKQIALTNLNITTQTSKPVSLSIQTASVELQETTREEKQQSGDDLKIKTATFSAMLEGLGLRLEVTNLQASDFVFVKDTDQFTRVVSCNTTAICRVVGAIHERIGVKKARITIFRRAADPWESHKKGIINTVVPELEIPSHHGPDAQTVIKNLDILTLAAKGSHNLYHLHMGFLELNEKVSKENVINALEEEPRVVLVSGKDKVEALNTIFEIGRELGRPRGDIYEIPVWLESISIIHNDLTLIWATPEESNVIPENVDAIRAITGIEKNPKNSIEKTDRSLGVLKRFY
jgi:glyceraldehyde-3-phosphate dehydrogenase type II